MLANRIAIVAVSTAAIALGAAGAGAQSAKPYAEMRPVAVYLMPDQAEEMRLARSAAPKSISGAAEIMVLGRNGYTIAVKGTNGFVCMVQRAFAAGTDFSEYWNPKNRSPGCFNAAAARSYMQAILLKARLAMSGKTVAEIARATATARDRHEFSDPEPGAMCYMMSKEQYLNDAGKAWHPHLMFFAASHPADAWGANHDDSPLIASDDIDAHVTILMLTVGHWSDGSAAGGGG
jgi:hypothetical protein